MDVSRINDELEPLSQSLAKAPFEDEHLCDKTIASIEHGRLCFERGKFTSHEDMLREFGASVGTGA